MGGLATRCIVISSTRGGGGRGGGLQTHAVGVLHDLGVVERRVRGGGEVV